MTAPQNIKISFIIPMYNREKYIEASIDSILKLTISEIEIIVVDDGSTDTSVALVRPYTVRDSRVRLIIQENRGQGAARNTGLSVVNGAYISFIDSDDWISPTHFEQLYHTAVSLDADVAAGKTQYIYQNGATSFGGFQPITEKIKNNLLTGRALFCELLRSGAYAPMSCSYIYKSSWIQELNIPFCDVIHEDELWTAIVLSYANRAIATDIVFYMYRQHDNSICSTINIKKRIGDVIFIANTLVEHIKKTDAKESDFISCFLLNILRLCTTAFFDLRRIKDSSFALSAYSFAYFSDSQEKISDADKSAYTYYLKSINQSIDIYQSWLNSELVTNLKTVDTASQKIILIFNTMWDQPLDIPQKEIPKGFIFTTDRRYFNEAHAIVFHLPTLERSLDEDLVKPDNQKWIAWSMESDENSPFQNSSEIMELFDYRMTYNLDADIVYPYYKYNYLKEFRKPCDIASKKSDICMMISSNINNISHLAYLKELMQYINIDSYGKLLNNKKTENDTRADAKLKLYATYKFVIAFENSCAEDYVTDQFYDPILAGAVPVYLGAPNIDKFAPASGSYIDSRDFESPKELATFLTNVCQNEALYQTYFEWKENPYLPSFEQKVKAVKEHPFVRLCSIL